MTTIENYLIPMPNGETATVKPEDYEALVAKSSLTVFSLTSVGAAGQLLAHVIPSQTRTLRELARLVHSNPEIEPSSAERRAIVALVAAGLVEQIGRTAQARYRLPSAV
ncbi:hypothetical protein C5B96_08560 [Subtercola sp. Z020]|uniref:hypothetical protein n=1 Tax=Subtercola sp. Z020 TaxID=2080582 RepID=UPI000CE85D8A|nr:hypothetical protein [Subtercola sp. Z020]PPF82978.1 hypothetical protein C5B96_08560 [Subtercola sp. Z020]